MTNENQATTAPRTSRGWLAAVMGLLATGLAIALYLTRLHLDLATGGEAGGALCDLSSALNCSAVNASPQAELLGVPQSVLGGAAYVAMAVLAGFGWRRRAPVHLLLGASLATVAYSAWLAGVSAFVLHAGCLFCMGLYAVNLGLAGLSWFALGRRGPLEAPRALVAAPALAVGAVLAFGAALVAGQGLYVTARNARVAEAVAQVAPAAPAAKSSPKGEEAAAGPDVRKVRVSDKRTEVAIPKDAPSLGPAHARVTLVEFSDFQCPFCKRLASGLRQLADEYPKDVRVVYLEFPLNTDCSDAPLKRSLHPEACKAASAAVCAGQQGHFWEMHDQLFENQASLKHQTYLDLAGDLGLNAARFEACLDDPATQATLRAQTALGAKAGVNGTPTFFVNGREMSGAQPIEVLRAVVDAELAGQSGTLDLSVQVGVEQTGDVTAKADPVTVSTLSSPFQIDAFEASMDGTRAVSKAGVEPARNTSWYDARDACAAAGRRLCTEQEWLAACAGTAPVDQDGSGVFSDDPILGRKYGYADLRKSGVCADSRNPDDPGDLRTGVHPGCGTPDGIYDLIGGVKEWVGLSPATAAVKGGSYSSGESARCGYLREDIAPDTKDPATGFRCCEGPAEIPAIKPGRDVGEKVMPFKIPLLDGTNFDLARLKGKPVILTFWASWCGPCKKELPALAALYNKYKGQGQGLEVLAISVDDDEARLRRFLTDNPLPFPIARDPGRTLMDSFTNRGVPTSLWIRKDGVIRLRTTGLPPNSDQRLEELVTELIQK